MNEWLQSVCKALRKQRAVRKALHICTSRIPLVKVIDVIETPPHHCKSHTGKFVMSYVYSRLQQQMPVANGLLAQCMPCILAKIWHLLPGGPPPLSV